MEDSQSPIEQKKISILIAEDHALFSQGIYLTLEATSKYEPIWQAGNGKVALELALAHNPQLILMDIMMPEMNGLQAARLIKAQRPHTKIIMLTSFTDENSVKIALSGGVEAYCSKDIDMGKLLSVIQMVLAGAVYLDPNVADFVLKNYFKQQKLAKPAEPNVKQPIISTSSTPQASGALPLDSVHPAKEQPGQPVGQNASPATISATEILPESRPVEKLDIPSPTPIRTDVLNARELELLSLIADNRNNEEIADILKIGSAWVDGYIKNIVTKLAVENEVEAVRRALEDGVLKKARLLEQDQ